MTARLLTIPEAAAELGVSSRKLGALIANGSLPCVRIGRRVLVDSADIAACGSNHASPVAQYWAAWLAQAPRQHTGVIYVVRSLGLVKIGYSSRERLSDRMCGIRTNNPHGLAFLCGLPGSVALEKAIHARLAHHRVSGEWFENACDVSEFVSAVLELSSPALQQAYLSLVGGALG